MHVLFETNWYFLVDMQELCHFFAAGDKLHVGLGDGLEADRGDKVDNHGNAHAQSHSDGQPDAIAHSDRGAYADAHPGSDRHAGTQAAV